MPTEVETRFGFLLVNKPSGPTSYDIIRWIKRVVKNVKIGHCGTLDPLASGLLIVLLGRKATRLQAEFMMGNKTYRCRMRLGIKTETGDISGKVVIRKGVEAGLDHAKVEETLRCFLGKRQQIPPMYSALKKEGVPLYKLARRGETVERKPRQIEIEKLDLLACCAPVDIEFRVVCSGGTYIRTLVEEIGEEMGTCATLTALVREQIGHFHLNDSVPAEKLKEMSPDQIWRCVREIPLPEKQ